LQARPKAQGGIREDTGGRRDGTVPLEQSFAGLMLQYAAGDPIDTTTSSRLFPFQMTAVRDFIASQLAAAKV